MFKQFFDKVVSSDLLRLDAGPEEGRGPYYRKPTLYMANSMALSGYDEWDVEAGIQKLLEAKKKKKKNERLTDIVTKVIGYARSIGTIRLWAQATYTKQLHKRPPLSNINWT